MRILFSGSLDVNTGGPAMSTYLTMVGLQRCGVWTEIIQYPLSPKGRLWGDEARVTFASKPWEHKLGYSHRLKGEIAVMGDFDIYHAQGIWQYPTYALIDVAKREGKPYLLTLHGMLYPQDIAKHSTFFKKLSLKWRLLKDLNHAACVHCTCEEEMRHCRHFGVTAPIAVITNPIEIKLYPYQKEDTVRRIGYLGRVSPRKKVERLIYAFAELRPSESSLKGDSRLTRAEFDNNCELLIIGGGDEKYERFLKDEVKRLNLTNVRFTGFFSGEKKDMAIASCSVIANPSDFENLGMVILEGLVREIPCIATTGSPWENLKKHQCGWWVPASQEAITAAVHFALETPEQELRDMGKRGRLLTMEQYSVEHVAKQMNALYEWVLGKGDKPDFVYE